MMHLISMDQAVDMRLFPMEIILIILWMGTSIIHTRVTVILTANLS
jgi:hypothetical protein